LLFRQSETLVNEDLAGLPVEESNHAADHIHAILHELEERRQWCRQVAVLCQNGTDLIKEW
jgi:hypothetical protein